MSGPAIVAAGGLTLIRSADGGHRIELRGDAGGGALLACLESIEPGDVSTPEITNWPASPPVQEWHDETRAGLTALMAVGRAGRSHWSLSCEVAVEGRATFDVAARINESPGLLGSSYRLITGTVLPTSVDRLQFAGGWRLTVDPLMTQLRYDAVARSVTIEPVMERAATWPQTIRWTYALQRRAK